MKHLMTTILAVVFIAAAAGCTSQTEVSPTVPPTAPTHRISGSVLPFRVGGYTALGSAPAPGQMEASYARDTQPLDLAIVSFDSTGEYGQMPLSGQQWYGASRCGTLWKGDPKVTPQPMQSACVTVLTDGVMTTVSGGQQTPEDLSDLANSIYAVLA